ncbi:MAG: hypothetical protein KIS68_15755 [Bauldia sp.]|nr:hypothetical protein [Bauldia sp.]
MIQHIGEVLAVIAVAFVVGSVVGWIAYRWIDRTDYAFDQRDLTDAIGRIFGVPRPPAVEDPAGAGGVTSLPPASHARPRAAIEERSEQPPVPARRPEPAPWPELLAGPSDTEPGRLEPAARSEAADDLRKRVQSSTRALAWREARDERLRPGETAAQVVAGNAALAGPPPRERAGDGGATAERPPSAVPSPARKSEDAAAEHDEPWAPKPDVWPIDLRRDGPPEGRPPQLALPPPVRPETGLALVPVATPPLAADDIWSDDDEGPEPHGHTPDEPTPTAGDRPPPLDEGGESDNLRRIKGIGQGFEKRLNQLGIYRYAQIAAWTERQQAWVSTELGFPGRVERDEWPAQARRLGRGADGRGMSEAEVVRDP